MEACSSYEEKLLKANLGCISHQLEYYPEMDRFHKNELMRYFDAVNKDYLVGRKTVSKRVDSRGKVLEYIKGVKEAFAGCLGTLPERGGENSRVVKTLQQENYFIDNVLIESLPGYYLTANFYYPGALRQKAPAILFLCGHSSNGKAYPMYVDFCVEAVLNGFCVLAFDPLGQGERRMYTEKDAPIFSMKNPDHVHYLLGQQISLTGDNITAYMMQDNVRALDYLSTRPEVDAARLAVAGNSGGGQMSTFMGVWDDRPAVIASACYITELKQMIHDIGAQECEQSLPGFMEKGLDLADLIAAAAPKPYFIGAGLMDFFPVEGTRDAYIEARRMYRLLEAEERLEIYISPKPHGFWCDTREKLLRFLCRHLKVDYIEKKQIDYEAAPGEEELWCTRDGDINSYNSKTLQEIVWEKAEKLFAGECFCACKEDLTLFRNTIRNNVLRVLGIDRSRILADIIYSGQGDAKQDNVSTTELCFYSEQYMKIYGTLYETGGDNNEKVMIHAGALEDEALRDELLKEFSTVFCIETRGTGRGKVEAGSWFYRGDELQNEEASYNCNAAMLGRSVPGMRVMDIVSGIKLLKSMRGFESRSLALCGKGENALVALYAAVLEEIRQVRLEELLYSYKSILAHRFYTWGPSIFAYGILKFFDIEELLMALMPAELKINGLVDHMKRRIGAEEGGKILGRLMDVAAGAVNGTKLEIVF